MKKLSFPAMNINVLVLLVFVLICINLMFFQNNADRKTAVSTTSHNTPTLNKRLLHPLVFQHGQRNRKRIALTFDADMSEGMLTMLRTHKVDSWYNSAIKDTLDSEHVKATIFFTGLWVETYPDKARELALDPLIEIGNHSYSHPAFAHPCYDLPNISKASADDEITKAQQAIIKATGIEPKYFRFPGGCYNANEVKLVSLHNLSIVHWDVAAQDGFNRDVFNIVHNVESKVQNGSIIVMHLHGGPYAPLTNDALKIIIPYLKQSGYEMVTVSELLNG